MRILFALILISGFLTAYCANIIEDCTGYKMEHTNPGYETKIVTRSVTRYDDNSTSTLNFNYHFFKYGDATAAPMPIVWIFIEWGGTVSQSEGRMRYETAGSDPFIAVVVKEGDGNDGTVQTGNWYWGNEYQGKSVPWAHLEVVDFITEIKTGETAIPFAGAVPDTNRFYAYGHSIGGTATDQIGIKHPELFAAFHGHAGWTRYWGPTNNFYTSGTFCRVFAGMIGGISGGSNGCDPDPTVTVKGNEDQPHLPLGQDIPAYQYTDLNWYFNKTGDTWNYRDPGFPSPFAFFTNGDADDQENQGDNLQPALESSRRGYQYYRASGGHTGGGTFFRWRWVRKFRRDQSFLAFTNRNYGLSNFNSTGTFNDLTVHGWDPSTIVDEAGHYYVKLTGTGTADVTLRRLQNLVHAPGTEYNVTINGSSAGKVTADEYGLVTIPQVANDASIDLVVTTTALAARTQRPGEAIDVWPNPFSTGANLIISSEWLVDSKMQAAVYDISGRKVAQLKPLTNNNYQPPTGYKWRASDQPAGVYIIKVNTGNRIYHKKITKIE
jgi:hypothetical protein